MYRKKFVFLGLEEMKLRRSELQAQIESQEEEKNNLQCEIEKMSCKLTQLNDSLAKRITIRNEYDRTIADTEAAYVKVKIIFLRIFYSKLDINLIFFKRYIGFILDSREFPIIT